MAAKAFCKVWDNREKIAKAAADAAAKAKKARAAAAAKAKKAKEARARYWKNYHAKRRAKQNKKKKCRKNCRRGWRGWRCRSRCNWRYRLAQTDAESTAAPSDAQIKMMQGFAKLALENPKAQKKIKHINTIKKFIEDGKNGKKATTEEAITACCAVVGLI